MDFLVSGGTGFVGAAIVRSLTDKHPGCTIIILDLSPPRPQHALPEKIEFMKVNVASIAEVRTAFQMVKPNVVIHTAGIVPALADRFGRRLEREVWRTNVQGTKNMLSAAAECGVKAFIYTSSCCVTTDDMRFPYPNINEEWPTSPTSLIYGESKAAAEALVVQASSSQMATCSLRPSVLFGPGDYQLVPSIHACIGKYQTPFIIGDGLNLWDVTYVGNVADAHILAAENLMTSRTAAGEAFFIQNNEPITFRDFCLAVWAQFGHFPPFEIHIPKALAYVTGLVGELATWATNTSTTLSRGSVRDACAMRYACGDKAKFILGYEPRVGIEEGIRSSCEEYAHRIGVKLPPRPP
ncbi:Sterol-4-alpha-carboxylate 3-dehydrogenase, decarboxylating [Penicillium rolfsii]|nr:Sterol-4-alpha-carboxylate 3-dehydrogenase, decarboxylating [Penicillium rolfsii]